MAAQNVLLLIADDWSPIARCYGNDVIHTPNIDALAKRATVFENAYCTTPSCAASRANILTGHYSHQHGQFGHSHGIHGFRTQDKYATRSMPALVRKAGAYSGIIGKAHVLPWSAYPFDVVEVGTPASNIDMRQRVSQFYKNAGDRPFYLHVGSTYPHRVKSIFDPNWQGEEFIPSDTVYDPKKVILPDWLPDTPAVRQDLADYYRFVTRFDQFVGVMLQELEKAGKADSTTIILMSDHGMPFPAAKASAYDSGHHCPLLIAQPGQKASRSKAMVNWCDILPTVCDAIGVKKEDMPDDLPGRSVLPILNEKSPAGWEQTFFSHTTHEVTNYYPYRVVHEQRFKLVHNIAWRMQMPLGSDLFASPAWQAVRKGKLERMGKRQTRKVLFHDREELFDTQNDPAESVNLINDPAHKATAERLRKDLLAFRERTGDTWLSVDEQEVFDWD